MSQEKEPPKIIAAKKTSEADQSWIKHQREVQQKTPERIEDAAKFLSGMISISLTIFLKLNPDGFKEMAGSGLLNTAVLLWIASLVFTFLVLFPAPYRYHDSSAASIRKMHKNVVRYKYGMLAAGAVLFLAALGVLVGLYVAG
ncbi:hypothetical protein [Phaeodactylibacter xiamenensis]|uniref:hypothetical protein n=1 Tax=Phaeodactylibacter xiamenensis TaxID=1524460 RepID=UPI0024A7F5F1|nr:hypothetical protein [Phaeodactylibacter xiamenensis]